MAGGWHFDTLQKIYIAFYQRPADPAGMKYWAARMAEVAGDSTAVMDVFAASAEARALYGLIRQDSLGDVIDKVYQGLFQRQPDSQGKAFYMVAFAQETLTVGNIALAILQGAQGDDRVAIENKLAVAREFTRQVDGRDFHDADFGNGWDAAYAYAGEADAATARTMLAGVTADPATILDTAAITRILQGVKPEGDSTDVDASAGGATISLITGDDDDAIEVEVDGTGRRGVSVWVDAGGGDDLIEVDNAGQVRMSLYAGAGDDRVVLMDGVGSLGARDVFDGGGGFDTLVTEGGGLAQDGYMALARAVMGFEGIEFTSRVEVDAGQLSQFERIVFVGGPTAAEVYRAQAVLDRAEEDLLAADAANPALIEALTAARDAARQALADITTAATEAGSSSVINVSEDQLLVARGSLDAWASGYQAAKDTEDVAQAGSLSLASHGAGATINAYGGQLNLTVVAAEGGEVATSVEGNVARAEITLTGRDGGAVPADTAPVEVARVSLSASANALSALSGITIEGAGCAEIYNSDGSVLESVDASGMKRMHLLGAGFTDMTDGLIYMSFNSKAETITLGAGADRITLWDSTVGSTDVVSGLHLVALDGMPGVLDMQKSDVLVSGEHAGFIPVNAGTYDSLEEALESLAAQDEYAVFHCGEDTYMFADDGNAQLDGNDTLVKLVGKLNLDLLASSLNAGAGF